MQNHHELILILDFGGQYTQLIARRVRELRVYCEILPCTSSLREIKERNPKGIILSGGPSSVYAAGAPTCDPHVLDLGVPVLGICYGLQLQAAYLRGRVNPSPRREYGHAEMEIVRESPLFAGLPRRVSVWMSHGDEVTELPEGFQLTARTQNAMGAVEDPNRRLYGLQFHPEVAHTPDGKTILENFLRRVCQTSGDWTMESFVESAIDRVRQHVGSGRAIGGLSGGVDSSVAATLVDRAIGDRLTCLFVDNGLLRKDEFEDVLRLYQDKVHLNVIGVRAADRFLSQLRGVTDPEQKRKIIGGVFIDIFQQQAARLGRVDFLVQGTLYPDVIESTSVKGPSAVIKSHHNVGGLPDKMDLRLVEPLRELFKDEVRSLGRKLGLPGEIIDRHPFPGPGLAVRVLGEVAAERLELVRQADAILIEEIKRANLYDRIWQAFAVLLPIRSVGVMGDERTYESAVVIRAVTSQDGMTADWAQIPFDVLARISNRIVSQVRGINRVVYDISSKPPSTIEWE